MTRSSLAWLLAALALFMVAPQARAATCSVSIVPINFGTFNPLVTSTTDVVGQVNVDCDQFFLPVTISLSKGNGSFAARQMKSGVGPTADTLNYNLYTDAARSTIFGDGTAGTDNAGCYTGWQSGGCNSPWFSTRASQPIYARLVGPQDVGVGTYTDTIQVTITF